MTDLERAAKLRDDARALSREAVILIEALEMLDKAEALVDEATRLEARARELEEKKP